MLDEVQSAGPETLADWCLMKFLDIHLIQV